MYLSAPFNLQNFYKKNLRVDSELWGCAPFLGPKQPICPEQIFLGHKPLLLLSSTYCPFQCEKFKRNLTMDPELWRCTIFGPKVVHWPLIIFFLRKPVNELWFFYSCLSTCQKSKSDINLSVKYWWFKNNEISLAESHFYLYLRARFCLSMHFSQDVNEPWELLFYTNSRKN